MEVLAIGKFTFQQRKKHRSTGEVALRHAEQDVAVIRFFEFPLGIDHTRHPMVPACQYVCKGVEYAAVDPATFMRPVAMIPEVSPIKGSGRRLNGSIRISPKLAKEPRYFCLDPLQ